MKSGSELRLFLSIDIVGSSRLKNVRNHTVLYTDIKDKESIISRYCKDNSCEKHSKEKVVQCAHSSVIGSDYDWAVIMKELFESFHSEYNNVLRGSFKDLKISKKEIYPWKAIGDELIYSFKLNRKTDVIEYLKSFYEIFKKTDNHYSEKNTVRLKGSAWIAGFPVRNRKIELPFPVNKEFEYPRTDYVGPDMDVGFRIGKCTWAGFVVVSIELAELLSTLGSDKFYLKLVGWEKLKGIWADRPYPIFWLFNSKNKDDNPLIIDGLEAESPFLYNYVHDGNNPITVAKEHADKIQKIRTSVSPEIGLIKPYIIPEDDIPAEHEEILKMIQNIQNSQKQNNQKVKANTKDAIDTTPYTDFAENLMKKKAPEVNVITRKGRKGKKT